jgi:hypothetical protein
MGPAREPIRAPARDIGREKRNTMTPDVQAAGTAAAAAARTKSAEDRQSLKRRLAHPDLSTPELIRDYLELVMVSVVTGDVPARAGAAAASICSRLLKSHELSITAELKELRLARERWEAETKGNTGVTRRRR